MRNFKKEEQNKLRDVIKEILKDHPELVLLGFGNYVNRSLKTSKFMGYSQVASNLLVDNPEVNPHPNLFDGSFEPAIYFKYRDSNLGGRTFNVPEFIKDLVGKDDNLLTRKLIL